MAASTLRQAVDSAISDEAALARVTLMQDCLRSTPEADKAADLIQKFWRDPECHLTNLLGSEASRSRTRQTPENARSRFPGALSPMGRAGSAERFPQGS